MPITATTTLPDADQPRLDNGVEDEVGIDRETQVTNNGQVRAQIRETGTSSWGTSATGFDEQTVAFDTLTFAFGGREDGEEYEVRLRTETAHRTGAWTTPLSIVTLFPGAAGLSATATGPTSVALSWTDNADNEDGQEVIREEQAGGSYLRREVLADVGPNTESYTDNNAKPDTTFRYRIRSFNTLRQAFSASETATTASLGTASRNAPAPAGYHVQVDREDGETIEPTLLNSPIPRGRLNGLPEIVVPIPLSDQWLNEEWERQPMRVWRDGERLPIERVHDVRVKRGDTDRVELVGRGGVDLRRRYEADVTDRSAHNVIRDALGASGYAFDVDDPPLTTDQPFATLSDSGDFANFTNIDNTDPVEVTGGEIRPLRTAYFTPLDVVETATTPIVFDGTRGWTNDSAVEFDVSNARDSQWTFETEYDIPAEHVGLYFRAEYDFTGYLQVFLDGQKVESVAQPQRPSTPSLEWRDAIDFSTFRTVSSISDLNAGTHTLQITTGGTDADSTINYSADGFVYLDVPVLFDTREWDPANFATTLTAGDRLDGPPGVYSPQPVDMRFQPVQRATGATLSGTFTDTSNDQSIGVGATDTSFVTTQNGSVVDDDFTGSTRDFFGRITLGGSSGSSGGGPNDGVEQYFTNYRTRPQAISSLDVAYDSLGSPTITELVDNPIAEIVTNKSNRANLIWEVQYDESIDGIRVVVTGVGTRTSSADPDIARYAVEKNLEREVSAATIYGRSQRVEAETFTGDTTPVSLLNDNLKESSERVTDSSGTEYISAADAAGGGDYEINYDAGEIEITSGGSMVSGDTYLIDYQWIPVGSEFRSGVNFQNHLVETINGISSDPAAEEAASFLVSGLDEPQWEADVTIPRREAGFNLVETIEPSNLPAPDGETYRIQSVDESADEITLTLGARASAGAVIASLRRSLRSTSREV